MGINRMRRDLPWALYLRVSSKDQGDKFSPAKQLVACLNHAKLNGAYVPGAETALSGHTVQRSEYILFDKQTGKNEDRPDFQRAWDLAKSGRIGGIVVYCVDRAARNVIDALKLRKQFRVMGVQLEFATQTFDHTPAGDMMYSIYSSFAEYEGQIILERTGDAANGGSKETTEQNGSCTAATRSFMDTSTTVANPPFPKRKGR